MQTETFNGIRKIVYETTGIFLSEEKRALVNARIAKRIRNLKLTDPEQYLKYLNEDITGGELENLVDVMSTNVTGFYREPDHFTFMRERVREWQLDGLKKLRIWSAASSTGEEPYTIAIEVMEEMKNAPLDFKVLATDISSGVLRTASYGEYHPDRLSPVPPNLKSKYFVQNGDNGNTTFRVNDSVKDTVIFRKFNLSTFPYPLKGQLDFIFCRNVMIYFDRQLKMRMVREFYQLLKPGGYLFVGHAESIADLNSSFKCKKPSIYLKE